MKPRVVLLDFDYTLGDSSEAIVECVAYALEKLGLAPATGDAIRRAIGHSLPEVLRLLTGIEDPSRGEAFRAAFVERADQMMAQKTRIFPGVHEAIERMRAAGLVLGIVSTKYRYRIEQILARNALEGRFETIVGADEVARPKPDPAALRLALERLGATPEEAVYVGDHPIDAAAARDAGIAFIGVMTGPSARADFGEMPALDFIDSIEELPGRLGV